MIASLRKSREKQAVYDTDGPVAGEADDADGGDLGSCGNGGNGI